MDNPWTIHILASQLVEVMPGLGRIMTHHAKIVGKEKATLLQGRTLFILIERPLTVSMLAKKNGVSLQAASVLVQGLVERGWVVRVPDPNDRRQSLLEVTPEGMARAQLTKDHISAYLAQYLDGFEPEELEAARIFLPALKRVLLPHLITDELPDEMPDEVFGGLPDE